MTALRQRLARLEAGITRSPTIPRFPSVAEQFAAIERCMLPKLSAAERDLWQQEAAPDHEDPVRSRLDEAFNRAAVEAQVPFAMCLADRWGNW
jgi:hypothetical protein